MKRVADIAVIIGAATLLAGCSLGNSLTTGSIFGGSQTADPAVAAVPAAPAAPASDPTSRAMQVGTVSARATKCGYNFDPVKLKTNFLAAETAQGATQADIQKISQIYDVSRNGVTKAVAGKSTYCTDKKTGQIKDDLTRHLAGDFTPATRAPEYVPEEGGILDSFLDDGGGTSSDAQGHRQIDAMN